MFETTERAQIGYNRVEMFLLDVAWEALKCCWCYLL